MARYAIISNGVVTNVAEGDAEWAAAAGAVRTDEGQIGWTYADGVFADPTPPPVSAPIRVITGTQAELALLQSGMLDAVEAFVETLPRATQIRWRRMTVLEREDAILRDAAAQMGLTESQLDALFALGATL